MLITGGFHTAGLTQRFKEQSIAYAVITPSSTAPLDEARYQSRLQNEIPPIEELIQKFEQLHSQALNPSQASNVSISGGLPAKQPSGPAIAKSDQQEDEQPSSKFQTILQRFITLKAYAVRGAEQLRAMISEWRAQHPEVAAQLRLAFRMAAGVAVISILGQEFQLDPANGTLLAMATGLPPGPGQPKEPSTAPPTAWRRQYPFLADYLDKYGQQIRHTYDQEVPRMARWLVARGFTPDQVQAVLGLANELARESFKQDVWPMSSEKLASRLQSILTITEAIIYAAIQHPPTDAEDKEDFACINNVPGLELFGQRFLIATDAQSWDSLSKEVQQAYLRRDWQLRRLQAFVMTREKELSETPIVIPTAWQSRADGQPVRAGEGQTVVEALDDLTSDHTKGSYPQLRSQIFTQMGTLRETLRVFIHHREGGEEDVTGRLRRSTSVRLQAGDMIVLIPSGATGATGGGTRGGSAEGGPASRAGLDDDTGKLALKLAQMLGGVVSLSGAILAFTFHFATYGTLASPLGWGLLALSGALFFGERIATYGASLVSTSSSLRVKPLTSSRTSLNWSSIASSFLVWSTAKAFRVAISSFTRASSSVFWRTIALINSTSSMVVRRLPSMGSSRRWSMWTPSARVEREERISSNSVFVRRASSALVGSFGSFRDLWGRRLAIGVLTIPPPRAGVKPWLLQPVSARLAFQIIGLALLVAFQPFWQPLLAQALGLDLPPVTIPLLAMATAIPGGPGGQPQDPAAAPPANGVSPERGELGEPSRRATAPPGPAASDNSERPVGSRPALSAALSLTPLVAWLIYSLPGLPVSLHTRVASLGYVLTAASLATLGLLAFVIATIPQRRKPASSPATVLFLEPGTHRVLDSQQVWLVDGKTLASDEWLPLRAKAIALGAHIAVEFEPLHGRIPTEQEWRRLDLPADESYRIFEFEVGFGLTGGTIRYVNLVPFSPALDRSMKMRLVQYPLGVRWERLRDTPRGAELIFQYKLLDSLIPVYRSLSVPWRTFIHSYRRQFMIRSFMGWSMASAVQLLFGYWGVSLWDVMSASGTALLFGLSFGLALVFQEFLHEGAHYLAARYHLSVDGVQLEPFRVTYTGDWRGRERHRAWIAAAGPVVHLMVAGVMGSILATWGPAVLVQQPLQFLWVMLVGLSSWSMAVVNLLPRGHNDGLKLWRLWRNQALDTDELSNAAVKVEPSPGPAAPPAAKDETAQAEGAVRSVNEMRDDE